MLHSKNFEIQIFKFLYCTFTFFIAVPFGGKCTKLEISTVVQLVLVKELQGAIQMIVVFVVQVFKQTETGFGGTGGGNR